MAATATSASHGGQDRSRPARLPGRRKNFKQRVLTPYAMLAPGIVLFLRVHGGTDRLHAVPELPAEEGQRTRPRQGRAEHRSSPGSTTTSASLTDPEFTASVLPGAARTALILIPLMLGFALLFALLLDSRRTRAGNFSRIAIFLPYAVPAVISSLLWGFLYLPGVSPFHFVARQARHGRSPSLLNPDLVTFAIANIALWGGVGFNMIVMYTSLKAVPQRDLRGGQAGRLPPRSQIALRIKIPIIAPSLVMTALFSMIATLQVFAEPTTLRPLANSLSTSWSPLMLVYRDAFTRNDVYSAAATSIVIALATFAISFLFLRVVQKRAFGQEN